MRNLAASVLLDETSNLSGRYRPGGAPTSDKRPLEVLVVLLRELRVSQGIREKRQSQLRRPRAAISPFKTGRAVASNLQMKRQRPIRGAPYGGIATRADGHFFNPHPARAVRLPPPAVGFLLEAWTNKLSESIESPRRSCAVRAMNRIRHRLLHDGCIENLRASSIGPRPNAPGLPDTTFALSAANDCAFARVPDHARSASTFAPPVLIYFRPPGVSSSCGITPPGNPRQIGQTRGLVFA
jgi:hypothetical protein